MAYDTEAKIRQLEYELELMRGLRAPDAETAVDIFKKLAGDNLYFPKAHFNWGYSCAELAVQQGGQEVDSDSVQRRPDSCVAEFHLGAGMGFAALGKNEAALSHFKKAFDQASMHGKLTDGDFFFTLTQGLGKATGRPPVETFQDWAPPLPS